MSGTFCTACGTRAKATDTVSTNAGPQAPPIQPAPNVVTGAPRKTSPVVWILVAVLGLFVLFGIAVIGGGMFLVHKARQAGLDPALMRTNPALATAKLLAATNPDLEVVSHDDGRGLVTIRQRSTGKTVTMNLDEMKHGKITFREDGKDAVTLEAHGDGSTGSLQVKSGTESLTMGANQGAPPAWIPAYPNSKPANTYSVTGDGHTSATFQFQTQDAAKDVVAFYEQGLKHNGFTINAATTGDSGTSAGGLVTGKDTANNRTVLVTVGSDNKGTSVSVTYTQK